MFNLFESIRSKPETTRQLACDELMVTELTCGLNNKMQDVWSQHNYFVYVLQGKKIWHTTAGAHKLVEGSCIFVRKGASIVEQLLDAEFCLLLFFIPDEFICETFRVKQIRTGNHDTDFKPVIPIEVNDTLNAFFHSILPYFSNSQSPDKVLLELKFRELLLNVVSNPDNDDAAAYFHSLLHEPSAVSLRKIMEDNFSFNLSLEQYAQLCNRSLSAFKRDFQKLYHTTPGRWITSRRLAHAKLLLSNSEKTVSEVAFESGFENLSHFSRAFRQHYGITPASIRPRQLA